MLCKLYFTDAVKSKQAKTRIREEPLRDEGQVHRRACGDGFTGACIGETLSDYTL